MKAMLVWGRTGAETMNGPDASRARALKRREAELSALRREVDGCLPTTSRSEPCSWGSKRSRSVAVGAMTSTRRSL